MHRRGAADVAPQKCGAAGLKLSNFRLKLYNLKVNFLTFGVHLENSTDLNSGKLPTLESVEFSKCIILDPDLWRCQKVDFSKKWFNYWRRDPVTRAGSSHEPQDKAWALTPARRGWLHWVNCREGWGCVHGCAV